MIIQIAAQADIADIDAAIGDWFVPESVAVSSVIDGEALVAGDFRIDGAGHMRFALLLDGSTLVTGDLIRAHEGGRLCLLPDAKLAYKTYGSLNAAKDNVVLLPTFFTGTHRRCDSRQRLALSYCVTTTWPFRLRCIRSRR